MARATRVLNEFRGRKIGGRGKIGVSAEVESVIGCPLPEIRDKLVPCLAC